MVHELGEVLYGHGPQSPNNMSRSDIETVPSPSRSGGPPGLVPHAAKSNSKSDVLTVPSPLRSAGHGGIGSGIGTRDMSS